MRSYPKRSLEPIQHTAIPCSGCSTVSTRLIIWTRGRASEGVCPCCWSDMVNLNFHLDIAEVLPIIYGAPIYSEVA